MKANPKRSRQGNDGARVFFALLPDAKTRAAIDYHTVQFSPRAGSKVRPENYHITLLFLGIVDRQAIDALCIDCDNIALPPFEMTITDVGWWRKAKILWLAPAQTPPALAQLVNSLVGIAARRKVPVESRDFFPHITLMRKVTSAPQHPIVQPFPWHAESFCLMQSLTHPDGVEYRELASWPLSG